MNPQVIRYAIESHHSTNHLYNGAPYSVHLAMVVTYAYKYIDIIPDIDRNVQNVIDACWLHDTIEDCRLTYNDIKNVAGAQVAEIVYAVTNEKGKTRSERANTKYYSEMKLVMWARFVKLCDRLANVYYSRMTNSKMYEMYQKEQSNFLMKLFSESSESRHYSKMINELNELLSLQK